MKKINTISMSIGKSVDILTVSQMSLIRGGTALNSLCSIDLPQAAVAAAAVGPISATVDDKRRDRPGGGVSTH